MRRVLLLLSSLILVLGLGGVAVRTQVDTGQRLTHVHETDRAALQSTLAGLTGQYFQFTFLASKTAADSTPWSLRPGDPADVARLQHLVSTSPLTSFGASLVSLAGRPLSEYSTGLALPGPTDPGYRPLRAALLAGQPGLSSVMRAGTTPVVAFAVPVERDGVASGLLITYASIRSWPLQGYDSTLEMGDRAEPYVIDQNGVVAASGDVTALGRPIPGLPTGLSGHGLRHLRLAGRDVVLSYGSAGQGWTALTVQDAEAFSGGVAASRQRATLALAVLLTLVVALLVLFHYKRQRLLQRLAEERLHDPLTGLAQRRLFELRIEASLARQRRSGQPLGLLYLDLDGFKGVNDRHGHNTGDQLLVTVADRLRQAVREDDLVARLGGDEFVVVAEATTEPELRRLVQRLYDQVQAPALVNKVPLEPRISIGGAVLVDSSRSPELLHEADLAMYQVKSQGLSGSTVITVLRGDTVPQPRCAPTTDVSSLPS